MLKKYENFLKQKVVKNSQSDIDHCRIVKRSDLQIFSDFFESSFKQSDKYYREKLFDLNQKYSIFPKEDTELLRIAIRENDVEMAHKFIENGADLSDLDSLCCTPLEEAIRCNNLEMICMLLYYGGYTNNINNNLTSFMFSIICQCSEDIQRVLMEYETDFNLTCDREPILFMAICYHSPLIFDLIERGANASFIKTTYRGPLIAPFVGVRSNCEVEIVKVRLLVPFRPVTIHNKTTKYFLL